VPSVTEVIDYLKEPELVNWIENNSKAKRKAITEESLRVGKEVDLLVQEDVREGGYLPPEGDNQICNCMKAWELWKKEKPEIFNGIVKNDMQRELSMIMDDGETVIGHPDLPIILKERWGILDVKSSKSIWPNNYTQDAIYTEMMRLEDKIILPRFIGILHLKKETGLFAYTEITDEAYIQYEVSVFKARYLAFNHAKNNREILRRQLEEELLK
jgi:hypothetical protein